jgi:hypothetical protein
MTLALVPDVPPDPPAVEAVSVEAVEARSSRWPSTGCPARGGGRRQALDVLGAVEAGDGRRGRRGGGLDARLAVPCWRVRPHRERRQYHAPERSVTSALGSPVVSAASWAREIPVVGRRSSTRTASSTTASRPRVSSRARAPPSVIRTIHASNHGAPAWRLVRSASTAASSRATRAEPSRCLSRSGGPRIASHAGSDMPSAPRRSASSSAPSAIRARATHTLRRGDAGHVPGIWSFCPSGSPRASASCSTSK